MACAVSVLISLAFTSISPPEVSTSVPVTMASTPSTLPSCCALEASIMPEDCSFSSVMTLSSTERSMISNLCLLIIFIVRRSAITEPSLLAPARPSA